VALLFVDASPGALEAGLSAGAQTAEHAALCRAAGCAHLLVVVNKMDATQPASWARERWEQARALLQQPLRDAGWREGASLSWVPCAGGRGENLTEALEEGHPGREWYRGPSLLAALLAAPRPPPPPPGAPLRLPVWELLAPGGPLGPATFLGRLEAGTLRAGMRCVLVPSGATCTVKAVDRGEGGGGGPPAPGEEVRVGLSGLGDPAALAPGQLLCPARQPCCAARRLRLRLSALASLRVPLLRGSSCVLHVAGQREEATVTRLLEQLDPRTGEVLKPRPRCLARGACGRVELSLAPGRCIAAEAFAECRPLGRAVLRDGGATLALGVVERVWSEAEAAEEAAEAAAAAEAAGEGR